MRNIWTVAMLQVRLVLRSKAMLIVMVAMPLMFTIIIGMFTSGATAGGGGGHVYPVALVDQDQSFASQRLVAALGSDRSLRLRPVPLADLKKLVAAKEIDSAVLIPTGFEAAITGGSGPEVQLMAPPGGNMQVGVGPIVRRHATTVAQDFLLARAAAEGSVQGASAATSADLTAAYDRVVATRQTSAVTTLATPLQKQRTERQPGEMGIGEYSLGFTLNFVMIMVFGMAGSILGERRQGTWGRLLTAPAARGSLLAGYLLSFFITGMLQFSVLIGLTTLIFHVHWGSLLPLFALAAAFILAASGGGLFLASIVKTPEQQNALGILFVTATSMLGGVYWPLEMVGDTMRRIGYLTPQAWAMDGFREVVLRSASWSGLIWPFAVLLLYALIFTTAGVLRVRYE
ncbi:MAG: ABC transporter permease [Symbiobacteriia bacterium]